MLSTTAVASMKRTEALASVKFYQILSIFIFFIRLIILEDFIRLISYNGPCVRLGCSFFLATALSTYFSRSAVCGKTQIKIPWVPDTFIFMRCFRLRSSLYRDFNKCHLSLHWVREQSAENDKKDFS